MIAETDRPFNRSGVARLSDLQTTSWKLCFQRLETDQAEFLKHEHQFRSPEYPWPRDPLHTWSRVWEYPFVYSNVSALMPELGGGRNLRVGDIGSGVTFLPFALAKLGCRVTCSDIDPVCGRDLNQAIATVPSDPGKVDFRLIEHQTLPHETHELDLACCVSVLEHIPNPEITIAEMARIIRPGGVLVLTVDLDLGSGWEISPLNLRRLAVPLEERFEFLRPDCLVHPGDVLTTLNSVYPWPRPFAPWYQLKERILKPLLGRKPRPLPHLAVSGYLLRRRP